MASISLVMAGVKVCKMNCAYCSAMEVLHPTKEKKNDFKYDWNKVLETIKTKPDILQELKNNKKQNKKTLLSVDIWGCEPLENIQAFKETVRFLESLEDFEVKLHTSTNGMSLSSEEIVNYLIQHQIGLQLSHDGVGQWIRSGEYDPLTHNKENVLKVVKAGLLDLVNCTLSKPNCSFFENIKYWNDWRFENKIENIPIKIKLNHIYPGTPYIKQINKFGHWQSEIVEEKKGTPIGDINIDGLELAQYMHEFKTLAIMFRDKNIQKNVYFRPYVDYILEQSKRFKVVKETDFISSCRSFQMGLIDYNFSLDTLGRFTQCNLIDADAQVVNPSGVRPEYCTNCEYANQAECHPCGSEGFPEVCTFRKEWCRTLEEFSDLDKLLEQQKNEILYTLNNL